MNEGAAWFLVVAVFLGTFAIAKVIEEGFNRLNNSFRAAFPPPGFDHVDYLSRIRDELRELRFEIAAIRRHVRGEPDPSWDLDSLIPTAESEPSEDG